MTLLQILNLNKNLCEEIKNIFEIGNIEKAEKICKIKSKIYYELLTGHTEEFQYSLQKITLLQKEKKFNKILKDAKEYLKNNLDFNIQVNKAKQFKKETNNFETNFNEAIELKNNDNDFVEYLKNNTNNSNYGLYDYYKKFLKCEELIDFEIVLNYKLFLFYKECLCMTPI